MKRDVSICDPARSLLSGSICELGQVGIRAAYAAFAADDVSPLRRALRRRAQLRAASSHYRRSLSVPVSGLIVFKWIKQHLRIKVFFGTSENAVKTQIWIAVSVYVLVAIVKKRLNLSASLYEMLQILSLTMFERIPLDQLLNKTVTDDIQALSTNQLNLFD